MKSKKTIPNYRDYLNLDSLLKSQKLISEKRGKKAHDEMLFIVSHQVYELWFKQILYEIDSVFEIFDMELVDESQIGTAVSRLQRINEIIQLLIDQIKILETMTPMDFLEFRDLLTPASGFQSGQFRQIENKIIDAVVEQSEKIFGKKMTLDEIQPMFNSNVKESPDREPKFRVKVDTDHNSMIKAAVYDANKNPIKTEVSNGLYARNSGHSIVELNSVYFLNKKFGCTWKLNQLVVYEPQNLKGFQFQI